MDAASLDAIERGQAQVIRSRKITRTPLKADESGNVRARRWWRSFSRLCTFLVADCFIPGASAEAKQAWREKIAICFIMLGTSALFVGGFGVLPLIICEEETIYTWEDIWAQNNEAWTVIHGTIYDMENLIHKHPGGIDNILAFLGKDASKLFPRPAPATLPPACLNPEKFKDHTRNSTIPECTHFTKEDVLAGLTCHDFAAGINGTRKYLDPYKRGILAFSGAELDHAHGNWIVIYDRVYNVTDYVNAVKNELSFLIEEDHENAFLAPTLNSMILNKLNQDATELYETLFVGNSTLQCMDELFYAGSLDTRFDPLCFALNSVVYVMLAIVGMVLIVKLIVSMRYVAVIDRTFNPEDTREPVLVMVPCYTETSEIDRTVTSLLHTEYPDDNKILMLVADGNITGKGNAKSTPQYIADMLGFEISQQHDQAHRYQSIGARTENQACVYHGTYTREGRSLKYIVIVKTGLPAEQDESKPGNRGKRDSQLIITGFFNRALNNREFCPLDIALAIAFKNHGFSSTSFKYLMTIDADTRVDTAAISHMVFHMNKNPNTMALCGETRVDNKTASWTTAIQVFEYYINHHMNKAFESFFGSVTCLPGCFTMYRIRDDNNILYVVSDSVLSKYARNTIDTLHLKNLYNLGEDRLLTTLLLLFFPDKKLNFVPEARCWTVVPHTLRMLLSQRRRWINSTIHNLFELLHVQSMCGVCFFSMRTVVALDLLSTLILPASTLYMAYLVYVFATEGVAISMLLLVVFALMIGAQLVIFVVRSQWQYLWWFLVFMTLGLPIFYILLPLYAFWYSDNVSWGSTRKIQK